MSNRTDKAAAELHAAIHRIKKSPADRMQSLRDRQEAIERRSRVAAVKAAASQPIVHGVDVYKTDRRREQDRNAEAAYEAESAPSIRTLGARNGPWFQHRAPAMPDEPGMSKGAAIFKRAQAGDPEAQRIVREAVSAVADQVQRAIATHAATTGGVNKAAGVDARPNTTWGEKGLDAQDLHDRLVGAEATAGFLNNIKGSPLGVMAPALADFLRAQQKIALDPVSFLPLTRPLSQSTPTGSSEEADGRQKLPPQRGTLDLGSRDRL